MISPAVAKPRRIRIPMPEEEEVVEAITPEAEVNEVVDAVTPNPEAETATVDAEAVAIKVPVSSGASLSSSAGVSAHNFDYLSLMPISYDFGGTGVQVGASVKPIDKLRILLRAGVASTYREALLGASYVITPKNAKRLSFALTGGIEFGRFSLEGQNIETSASDTGVFGRAKSHFVLNNRFEIQGGVGFSSFFDGDPHVFGGALYHITQQLDLTSEIELGDNDSIGLGVRYYY